MQLFLQNSKQRIIMLRVKKIDVTYWQEGKLKCLQSDKFPCQNEDLSVVKFNDYAADETKFSSEIWKIELHTIKTIRLQNVEMHAFITDEKISRVFTNGFQSWTNSREYLSQESMPGLRSWLAPISKHYYMQNYGDYSFVKYSNKSGQFHSFTYTYITLDNSFEKIMLLGSLSEQAGYTIFHWDIENNSLVIQKDCEGLEFSGNLAIAKIFVGWGERNDLFLSYFDSWKILEHNKWHIAQCPPCTGWTSWYNYYQNIDQNIILTNLNAFQQAKIPIQIFQIDDGYQKAVGDWEANEKFPHGMKFIADEIHKLGYEAGLWLAPFICEEKSSIYHNHPDWLISENIQDKHKKNRPKVIGYNPFHWSGNFYALNFYHPEVQKYLRNVFSRILYEWGFDLVKLDFLYAVALFPYKGHSRGQIMVESMQFLREIVGNKKILGCGVPLGPAFGQVDYCRIGSDVALSWEDYRLKFIRFRERVSTVNALTNTIFRNHLNRYAFGNDPDVFIFRDKKQKMSGIEKETLLRLNLVFGELVFTSDNISEYSLATFQLYRKIFPHHIKMIHSVSEKENVITVHFEANTFHYIIIANLSNKKQKLPTPTLTNYQKFDLLPGKFYDCENYYSEKKWKKFVSFPSSKKLEEPYFSLAAHASKCFLYVPSETFAILGTNGHIFPGNEIETFFTEENKVQISWHPQSTPGTQVLLQIPSNIEECWVNERHYLCVENGKRKQYILIEMP